MNFHYLMYRKLQRLPWAYIIFLLLSSCEYTPDKVFTNPTKPDPGAPNVNVVELNLEEDTVYLYFDKTVTFKFSTSNQEIRNVVYEVDNAVKETVSSGNGEFIMTQNDFYDGVYTLSIKVYTGSGTGSIADQVGAEGYLYEKKWVLIVTRTYGMPVSYTAENGYLRLDWAPYHGSELSEFVVYRPDENYSSHEVGRSTTNHFIDSCYVGEGGNYSIRAKMKSGEEVYWGYCQLSKELPRIDCSSTPTNQYYVYWSKSRFFKGIAKVDVFQRDASDIYQPVYSSSSYNDSIYSFSNRLFGERINFMIKLIPRKYSFGYLQSDERFYTVSQDIYAGYNFSTQISSGVPIKAVENNEILYDDRSLGLVRFSLSTLKNTEAFSYKGPICESRYFSDLDVSPMGKYYISHICDFEHFISASSSNLGNYQVNDLSYLTGQQAWKIPISDNMLGLIGSLNWGAGIYLYNFNTQSILAEYTNDPTMSRGVSISSNGDYMFISDYGLKLFHYSDHTFTEKQLLPFNLTCFVEFSRTDADQFAFYDQSVFRIERCSDLSIVYSFPLQGEKLMSVDYRNKQILTAANLHLYVRSMIDGSLLYDIPVRTDEIYSYYTCCLADHKIISSLGVIYFL
ncbi:MAG: hypothetical protein WC780_04595 [Lentimicrobiaceae bacterium]